MTPNPPTLQELSRYLTGDPEHDIDLLGAAAAVLADAERSGLARVRYDLADVIVATTIDLTRTAPAATAPLPETNLYQELGAR